MVTLTRLVLNSWDDWVQQDRLRKLTDENKELALALRREVDATFRKSLQKASSKKRGGSDSGRGSEERGSSVPGRGTKRGRDNEIEKVRKSQILFAGIAFHLPLIWFTWQQDL
jgi:hypothetical protein